MEKIKPLDIRVGYKNTYYKIEFTRLWKYFLYNGGYRLTIYKGRDCCSCYSEKLIEVTLDIENRDELINCENRYTFLKYVLTDYLGIQCWREFMKFLVGYSTLILDSNKHIQLVEEHENVIEYNKVYLSEEELNLIVQDSVFNKGIEVFHQEKYGESKKIEVEIPKKPLISKGEFYSSELYWEEKEHQIIQPLEPSEPSEEEVLVAELPKEGKMYKIKPLPT